MHSTSNKAAIATRAKLAPVTRQITGKPTVSVVRLSNLDVATGTATHKHNGLAYDAVRVGSTWMLTGDYSY